MGKGVRLVMQPLFEEGTKLNGRNWWQVTRKLLRKRKRLAWEYFEVTSGGGTVGRERVSFAGAAVESMGDWDKDEKGEACAPRLICSLRERLVTGDPRGGKSKRDSEKLSTTSQTKFWGSPSRFFQGVQLRKGKKNRPVAGNGKKANPHDPKQGAGLARYLGRAKRLKNVFSFTRTLCEDTETLSRQRRAADEFLIRRRRGAVKGRMAWEKGGEKERWAA